MKVLVVGAGPTGALVAHLLHSVVQPRILRPISVSIWEKARGCGGRMTTSRLDASGNVTADVGAQYITSTPHYQSNHQQIYTQLLSDEVLQPFTSQVIQGEQIQEGSKNFVCTSGINSIAKYFIKHSEADLKLQTRLVKLLADGEDTISVHSEDGLRETFDCVILTIPTAQMLDIQGMDIYLDGQQRALLQHSSYSSRFALGIRLPSNFEPPVDWTAKYVTGNPCVRYISIDTKKRKKGQPHTLVVHTSVPYGLENLEEDKELVGKDILAHLRNVIPWLPSDEDLVVKSHKWRYSQVRTAVEGQPGHLTISMKPRVILCGDAFTHSNLDGCISSAYSAINSLL